MLDLRNPDDVETYKHILRTMQRQCSRNLRAGKQYKTTVGAVAKAVKMEPAAVASELRKAWLVILYEDPSKPPAEWAVEQDGE